MKVLITGSSGFIGSALVSFLSNEGFTVTRLVRSAPRPEKSEVQWNPSAGTMDKAGLEGHDAVVHLAGENAAGRWTQEKKDRIRASRVEGTRLLCETLARLSRRPQVLISASAIGYYGNRQDEILKEDSLPGSGFLADVCRQWEAATEEAARRGIRVVRLRIGMVLSATGGALPMMLSPFKMGLGGRLGTGTQYMSWIALDDLLGAILHAIKTDSLHGPVNAVAPNPVTNLEFTATLGRALHRPTPFSVPASMARLAFGEMAEEVLLSSARVEPAQLLAAGYIFHHVKLEEALRYLLEHREAS